MIFIRLLPVILSLLLLSAHFSRSGVPILSLFFLLLPFFLIIKKIWVVQSLRIVLIIGSIEWIRTLFYYIEERQTLGEPYFRLIIIIGSVALFTGLSILSFKNEKVKDRYNYQ